MVVPPSPDSALVAPPRCPDEVVRRGFVRHLIGAPHLLLVTAFTLFLTAGPVAAQDSAADVIDTLREAFRRLDYEAVDAIAAAALEQPEMLSPDDLVDVHVLAGLAHFYRGHEAEARGQFESALSLDQELTLNLRQASPDAVAFFDAVRATYVGSSTVTPTAGAIRYLLVHDRRPAAAVRSFLLPGWGQLYKGQRLKGVALVALWTASAGGGLAAHLAHAEARDAYEAAGVEDVQSRYDTMNRWHKLRKQLALGAAVVWGISAVDAVLSGGPVAPGSGAGLSVSLLGPDSEPGMRLQVRF